jgi:hypothetical protein
MLGLSPEPIHKGEDKATVSDGADAVEMPRAPSRPDANKLTHHETLLIYGPGR